MAVCNCSTFTLSHRSGLLGQPEPNPAGETASQERGKCYGAFFHFVRVQRKSVKEAASLVTAEVAVVWEKSTDPPQKKSRCVERILRLYASLAELDRSKKRSAGVDVENAGFFSLALMSFSTLGTRTPSPSSRWTRIGSSCWAALPGMDPVASCKESTNPWPTGERTAIHRLLRPVFRPPEIQLFKRFVKWWPLANQASSKPLDGADKIIATCHALLKEKQPRDDYRERVQLTIIVLGGGGWGEHPEAGRLPPARGVEKGDRAGIGKVMARHMWYVSEELVGLCPLRRGDGGRGEAGHRQRQGSSGGGRKPRLAAPNVALDAVEQRSLASFATTNSVGLVPALGPVTFFLNVDPAEWSGRDDYTTARRRPVTYGWGNYFAERGVALISAFCGSITRDEEQRQHLLQCQRFHSHRLVLRSQLLTLNVGGGWRPTPPGENAVIRLTCAFLRKTGQLQRL
ncbi:hypothetical protein GWK47_008772 [Chionoecetes opilio]|uniref:Uncharacterized protein n=1 Tax=Chionoecetes opilio TaxID=41210 RepID=A0A8J5CPZ0_CHIOP|nr:hypothetical protein GWK47_008772 [Chionoecetes opilio]